MPVSREICDLRVMLALALAGAPACFTDTGIVGASEPIDPTTGASMGDATGGATGEATGEATCGTDCGGSMCGDGIAAPPEQCDDGNDDNSDACTEVCTLARCGDGFTQAGEECDDGAGNGDAKGCVAACKLATCGDGLVQVGVEACDDGNAMDGDGCSGCQLESCGNGALDGGEECDDGNMVDTDECRNNCVLAVCGDGVVASGATPPEECDDGNMQGGDGCLADCTLSTCGDGVVDVGEECDDGDQRAGDSCAPDCTRTGYLVFVTSESYTGSLGGVDGADVRCNALAEAAGLAGAGTYKAWISGGGDTAGERLYHSPLPYVRVDGDTIADDWIDLIQGGPIAPIAFTELGLGVPQVKLGCDGLGMVWTSTDPNGTGGGPDCMEWSFGQPFDQGIVGLLHETNSDWTSACEVQCDSQARLYCFEQPAT